jgi:hypothetical protein
MSGCALLKSTTSTQLNTIGKVQITSILCAGDTNSNNAGYSPTDSACQGSTKGGNYNGDAVNGNYQISIAYRISNGVSAPSSFTSTNTSNPPTTPCGSGVVFNQNAGLATALQGLSPAGSGKKWVAYYSTVQNYTTGGCQYLTVAPQFTLPQGFGIVPFQGPVNYRTIVGWRQVNESQPGNTSARAATCGNTAITSTYTDGVDSDSNGQLDMSGICADDPTAAVISGADASQPTRDLGVIPTGNASVNAGQTANVSFNLSYKGAALPSGHFDITANTTISGATATPSIATLTPNADTDTSMNVSVPVPPGTSPGTYDVYVIATLSTDNTQTRGGIIPATITVGEAFGFSPAPALPNPLFATPLTLNGQAQTTTAQMNNFGVIDSPGSSDQGWNVTVVGDNTSGKSPVLRQYCPNATCGSDTGGPGFIGAGYLLGANSLTLNTSSGSWSGGTGSAPSFNCNAGGCAIDAAPGSPTKIASATNGNGTALWSATGFNSSSLTLSTPSNMRVLQTNEVYKLNIAWSLNSGP